MLKNFYINPDTGDLDFTTTRNLRMTTDKYEYYSQKIEQVLKTYLGEVISNRDLGLPWVGNAGNLMDKGTDPRALAATIVRAVHDIPGIDAVTKYEANYDNETLVYSATIAVLTVEDGELEGEFEI